MRTSLFKAILYGWITIVILMVCSTFVLALMIRFADINEFTIYYVTLLIALIILFIGGLVAGIKGKDTGWLIGLLTGAGFTFITFIVQFLGYDQLFSIKQLSFHIAYIIAAIAGSIIGVNFIHTNEPK